METIEQRALKWAGGDDTGASSMTIYRHMLGIPQNGPFAISEPFDGGDLGRCLRLLRTIPEWSPRMPEMAGLSNTWAALVPHWDELATLLASEIGADLPRHGRAPKTFDRIASLTMASRSTDGWVPLGTGMSIRAST